MKNTKTYSNCRVSQVILYPDDQHVRMNGFAFSVRMGMVHEVVQPKNEDWQQWLGTHQ